MLNIVRRTLDILKSFRQKPLEVLITFLRSAKFVLENLCTVPNLKNRSRLFRHSISKVEVDGLFLEFGVYRGESINCIASLVPDKVVYGFDSFEGLPEDWKRDAHRGTFRLDKLPKVKNNVNLVVGLFEDTLEQFLEEKQEKVSFVHCDADLYSSTKHVLFTLTKHDRLQRGTVIQFDEFFGYRGWWTKGEYKAFLEFVKEFNVEFEYLGYDMFGRVSIKILKI